MRVSDLLGLLLFVRKDDVNSAHAVLDSVDGVAVWRVKSYCSINSNHIQW